MIKLISISFTLLSCLTNINTSTMNKEVSATSTTIAKSIYDFKVEALDGGTIDFSKFKGKKILIVNTASACGYTPQYEGLVRKCCRNRSTMKIPLAISRHV